jgi:hypothetical protein
MLQNNGFAVMIVASTAVAVVTDGRVCQKYCEFFISIMLEPRLQIPVFVSVCQTAESEPMTYLPKVLALSLRDNFSLVILNAEPTRF